MRITEGITLRCIPPLIKSCRNHSTAGKVRVRFAPSPTGHLHLGGLRTALYNFLFAKSRCGSFVLRIEDTDQTRLVDGAAEKVEYDLEWIGAKPDESPMVGGPYAPYKQSQRLDIYKDEVNKLLENGTAYYCFCTSARLDILRRDALRRREVPKYDNKCRNLTKEEVDDKLKTNVQYCIRFKLMPYKKPINDMVFGAAVHDIAQIEGDPIILKSDGYPTYHLANVVDDHYMEITHVLRGVEWRPSTTKHILLYNAFQWNPPLYAHLPLLLNTDGSKLSKRQSDITVETYRKEGIFPGALINFVITCGGGFGATKNSELCKPIDELSKNFDLSKVNAHSCQVPYDRLNEFNNYELRRLINNQDTASDLVEQTKMLIKNKFQNEGYTLQLDNKYVYQAIKWSVEKERISKLNDLVDQNLAFLWIKPSVACLPEDGTISEGMLKELINQLQEGKIDFKEFSKRHEVDYKNFMKFLRAALSGLKKGPSIAEMIEILGKENITSRLREVLDMYTLKANKKI